MNEALNLKKQHWQSNMSCKDKKKMSMIMWKQPANKKKILQESSNDIGKIFL